MIVSIPSDSAPLFTELLCDGARATLLPERAFWELSYDPQFAALSSSPHFDANNTLTRGTPERAEFLHCSGLSYLFPCKKTILRI